MSYKERIEQLVTKIPKTILDLSETRKRGRIPTQASSDFLINRERGDWGERLVQEAINAHIEDYVAVMYGKSDRIAAGEEGFKEFFEEYQDELEEIGKRPDLLIFHKDDYDPNWGLDISGFKKEELERIVPLATAGFEVRTSSYNCSEYAKMVENQRNIHIKNVLSTRDRILWRFSTVLDIKLRTALRKIDAFNIESFEARMNTPKGIGEAESEELRKELDKLRMEINNVKKRDFLSYTPKQEDLYLVCKWIETFGVPHFYVQVFKDDIYCIPFEKVLELLSDETQKKEKYFLEKDVGNHMKTTVKIDLREGKWIGRSTEPPERTVSEIQLNKGKVVEYIVFEGGKAELERKPFQSLLPLKESTAI